MYRPTWTLAFLTETGAPYDLRGCTVSVIYNDGVSDVLFHTTEFDLDGTEFHHYGLELAGTVADGVLIEHFDAASDLLGLPLGTTLTCSVQLTDWTSNDVICAFSAPLVIADESVAAGLDPASVIVVSADDTYVTASSSVPKTQSARAVSFSLHEDLSDETVFTVYT